MNTVRAIRRFVEDNLDPIPADASAFRSLLALLKTVTHHPDEALNIWVAPLLLTIFDCVALVEAGDGRSFAKDALRHLTQMDVVQLDALLDRARTWPPGNQLILVDIINRQDPMGANSPLLDRILAWHPDVEVQSHIWRAREIHGGGVEG